MDFPQPLARARLVRRYKRFLADVVIDGETEETTVHVPNPGSMLGLAEPGMTVWLSRSSDPRRKLAYTLELVEADGGIVGVNTQHPNRLAAEAIAAGLIPELAGYATARAEVRYGQSSRIDLLLQSPDRSDCWVEVKGVTLCRQAGLAEWPDCTSARATKHLRELEEMARQGDRAVVLFVAQRADCDTLAIASDLDPAFAAALERVTEAGVEVLAYACEMGSGAIRLSRRLEWRPAAWGAAIGT
jgi:sugar fermentation stimulation protein A